MIPIWDAKYSINNDEIDAQHKKLFELARKAYIYANKNISKDDMKGIIGEFFEYMKEHFSKEELYMEQIGYPRLEEHSKIHKDIINSMSNLIRTTKNINDMKENLVVIAERWLIEHILQNDVKIEEWRRLKAINIQKDLKKDEIKYEYVCGCQNKIHNISKTIHDRILQGKKYSCSICNQLIKIKDR
ncbi:bacteriohemerythrin [Campylobacter hyointestinalis]|uniref:Bacteriohemerythrin n=1 Tax=Campylobacter hyointestinalis TaxID=198 RepID=A0A562XFW9_CAMHY|nr:bacteriohemerythrin [Campylobacter hyointestinalis]RAZ46561.1 hemerythrin family non-heme iron protein [Campylobacter hyointestinalis subsp. lawsonii]TWO20503.1 bacteriohemerythrin [Campylobacter hyointestinalis]